jgi:Na+-driven multidrug efflux pump
MVGLLAALTVPLVWFAPVWLGRFGLEPGLLEQGAGYTRAMALTLVPMLGVMLYRTILTAAEKPKVFLQVTLAMLPLNALANYVFMTGAGPIPGLGPTGPGVSSLLVAAASLTVLVIIARRGVGHVRYIPHANGCSTGTAWPRCSAWASRSASRRSPRSASISRQRFMQRRSGPRKSPRTR